MQYETLGTLTQRRRAQTALEPQVPAVIVILHHYRLSIAAITTRLPACRLEG